MYYIFGYIYDNYVSSDLETETQHAKKMALEQLFWRAEFLDKKFKETTIKNNNILFIYNIHAMLCIESTRLSPQGTYI